MIKGCIFDMDGTLLDSMKFWIDCGKNFVLKNNLVPEEGLSKKLFCMSLNDGNAYLQKKYFPDSSAEEVGKGVAAEIADAYKYSVEPKSGARELLERLYTKKIKCALATATPRNLFEPAFERLGLTKYFSVILTCPELNTHKDVPRIYEKSAQLLGTHPGETAVFEDALFAATTAARAGFYTVGVFDELSADDSFEMKKICNEYLKTPGDFVI